MCAINVAHLETQGNFRFSKIGVESLYFSVFFVCAINAAHLETQGIFWTSKLGAESLYFSVFFYVCHQRGAFGNPGNFLDFKNRRGIPIFVFFMCAINVAHLETQAIFWTPKIGVESLFLIFFMCAINVAHLETQGVFWTSKIGAESLILFFLCVPSTWRFWKPRQFFGLQK